MGTINCHSILAIVAAAALVQASLPVWAAPPIEVPVRVTNDPSEAIPVAIGDAEVAVTGTIGAVEPGVPFQVSAALVGETVAGTVYTVPEDKRFVIEYASFQFFCTKEDEEVCDAESMVLEILTTVGGARARFAIGFGHPSEGKFAAGQAVSFQADPSTEVAARVVAPPFVFPANFQVDLAGRLVDTP
jgi:hypothetical protein